ncbi:MAG TPA: hypothetical protein VN719_06900 [Gemmatimonadales bacterium]|nr:hypothetical protein [Gemmatimonadales bacterium]
MARETVLEILLRDELGNESTGLACTLAAMRSTIVRSIGNMLAADIDMPLVLMRYLAARAMGLHEPEPDFGSLGDRYSRPEVRQSLKAFTVPTLVEHKLEALSDLSQERYVSYMRQIFDWSFSPEVDLVGRARRVRADTGADMAAHLVMSATSAVIYFTHKLIHSVPEGTLIAADVHGMIGALLNQCPPGLPNHQLENEAWLHVYAEALAIRRGYLAVPQHVAGVLGADEAEVTAVGEAACRLIFATVWEATYPGVMFATPAPVG